ncbi:hypothetical protein [Rhizobium sp. Root1220]|uniref:hypothetical protein n=1 Tax=Rhizobium sp. Root1220 TaxID=1736432 RepID=UPI0006F70A6D|nr:hypothetical protein [Rhizobium sp. Root1220]KQV70462.1 hypothetical protein ASC90_10215 [Rhizobium sp. Root1220]
MHRTAALICVGIAICLAGGDAQAVPQPKDKKVETRKSKAEERRYRRGFNQGITHTAQLDSAQLQEIRKRMISHRRVSYRELQMLADHGDGVAALFVAKTLAAKPALNADTIHYYTIASSTGRAGAVAPLARHLASASDRVSKARLDQAEATLLQHAARKNPVAIAALLKFYAKGEPFGPEPQQVERLQREAAKGGNTKVALDLAIAMISEGLSDDEEKSEARSYLAIAETSKELSVKTVAAAVLRKLESAPVNSIEVSQ